MKFIIIFIFFFSYNFSKISFPFYTKENFNLNDFRKLSPKMQMEDSEDLTYINLCLGTPPQCFELNFQTNNFYLWIMNSESKNKKSKHSFNIKQSSTVLRNMTKTMVSYFGKSVIGYPVKDILTINNEKFGNLNFLLAEEIEFDLFSKMDGMIGLGYTPNSYEIQFSILEQFYRNKIISHRVYMQKFSSEKNGEILFGELPEEAFSDTIHYGRCSAVDVKRDGKKYKNKNWQCQINAIFLTEKNNFQVAEESEWMKFDDKNIAFNSNNKRSFFPKRLLEAFRNIYFKDLLESKKCEEKVKRHITVFECDKDINFNYDLNLVLNDWIVTINNENLFKSIDDNKIEFNFCYRPSNNKFILGRNILYKQNMVYDFENKQIGFYNKDNVHFIGKFNPSPPRKYTFVKDDDDLKPKKAEEKSVNILPEAEGENGSEFEKTIEVEKTSNFKLSEFLQTLLSFLIILMVFIIVIFVFYSYNRYKKIRKFKKNIEYYQKQTDNISSENLI